MWDPANKASARQILSEAWHSLLISCSVCSIDSRSYGTEIPSSLGATLSSQRHPKSLCTVSSQASSQHNNLLIQNKWKNLLLQSAELEFYIMQYNHRSDHLSPLPCCSALSHVCLFVTPWTAARQAALFFTSSGSLLKFMSMESVMPSYHLILGYSSLLLLSIFPSIRVFSSESSLCTRWPKYWSFSFSISPSNEYFGLISFKIDWLDVLAVQGLSRVLSSTTIAKYCNLIKGETFTTFAIFF